MGAALLASFFFVCVFIMGLLWFAIEWSDRHDGLHESMDDYFDQAH